MDIFKNENYYYGLQSAGKPIEYARLYFSYIKTGLQNSLDLGHVGKD